MKLDRLLSIVILLINRKMVQAKELAERFEVSVRTIYRDIETINMAGIPIVTYQGAGGGIGLEEGYRLDRNLLTNDELAALVTALRSISTSYDSDSNQMLMEKLTSIVPASRADEFRFKSNQVLVDLSPWGGQAQLEQKFKLVKQAIEQLRLVSFTYISAQGDRTQRTVEPHTLVLKGQKWYLQAYCLQRGRFRLFKLLRMKDLAVLDEVFVRRAIPEEELNPGQTWNAPDNTVPLILRFSPQIRHLAEEWFGVEDLKLQGDGSITVNVSFPEDNWLYGFILSFGPDVEVVEPEHIRQIIQEKARLVAKKYEASSET
ncbi:helix-turn-helix transcriptional regulator [Paenibacillus tarimensis]